MGGCVIQDGTFRSAAEMLTSHGAPLDKLCVAVEAVLGADDDKSLQVMGKLPKQPSHVLLLVPIYTTTPNVVLIPEK